MQSQDRAIQARAGAGGNRCMLCSHRLQMGVCEIQSQMLSGLSTSSCAGSDRDRRQHSSGGGGAATRGEAEGIETTCGAGIIWHMRRARALGCRQDDADRHPCGAQAGFRWVRFGVAVWHVQSLRHVQCDHRYRVSLHAYNKKVLAHAGCCVTHGSPVEL